jgi:hypothetical protein
MPRKATKKLITTFDLRKTFGTYKKFEKALTENQIPFRVESGSYGGGGKVFYDYIRNAIVITSYLQRAYYNPRPNTANIIVNGSFAPIYELSWEYTHYIIEPTPENIKKLNRILKVNISIDQITQSG